MHWEGQEYFECFFQQKNRECNVRGLDNFDLCDNLQQT